MRFLKPRVARSIVVTVCCMTSGSSTICGLHDHKRTHSEVCDCKRCNSQGTPAHGRVQSAAQVQRTGAHICTDIGNTSCACFALDSPLMSASMLRTQSSGSCMSHSRLHVLVARHHALREASGPPLRTSDPTRSIRSSGSDSRPIILGSVIFFGASAMLGPLAASCQPGHLSFVSFLSS